MIYPSSNPSFFEPELEFFVFSPGGVASTGLIQSTQTSCSTTPAATVSRPPPCRAPLSPLPFHSPVQGVSSSASHTPVSMATTLHCRCPWLQPSPSYLHLPSPTTSNPVYPPFSARLSSVCIHTLPKQLANKSSTPRLLLVFYCWTGKRTPSTIALATLVKANPSKPLAFGTRIPKDRLMSAIFLNV